MIYQGAKLSENHEIQVTIDGVLALVASGKERIEFLATPPNEPPDHPLKHLHQRPDADTIDNASAAIFRSPRNTRKIAWQNCSHTMSTSPIPSCPYCRIDRLEGNLQSKSDKNAYQNGYVAGRARYIYLKNKFDRIEAMLIEISKGRITDPVASAKAALQREKKNRRGGLGDDMREAATV